MKKKRDKLLREEERKKNIFNNSIKEDMIWKEIINKKK